MSLQKESVSEKLLRRDSEELRKNGEQLKAIRLQKESEWWDRATEDLSGIYIKKKESGWEKELANLLVEHGIAVKNVTLEKKLWQIFSKAKSQAVANREKEIAEKYNECGKKMSVEAVVYLLRSAGQAFQAGVITQEELREAEEDAKARIKKIISQREKEIEEEVKKIKTAGHDECNEDFLINVLSILKH